MPARPSVGIPHAETDGSGPPLLLLPGFACTSEAWGVAFVRTLAGRLFVIRPDWPGTGRSPRTGDGSLTIAELAEAALHVLRAHTAARSHLLGWGLGALVALQLAVDRPERVERLILLGGAAHGAALLAATPTVAVLCGVGEDASAEEHMVGLLDRLVSAAWRPFAQMFLPQLLPRPAATLAALRGQWAALAGYDLRPRLAGVRAPTLILAGAEDRLAPPALAEHLRAGMPDAKLRLIAGAGHAALWEQPGAVLEAILPFLDGAPTREPAGAREHALIEGRTP